MAGYEKSFGLLGKSLKHSFSPIIHSLLGNKNYALIELDESELEKVIASDEYGGFNVTVPYKKTVIPFLDTLSEAAKEIGAVNTIIHTDKGLHGDNTDFYGFTYLLKKTRLDYAGKKCLILGSGGTAATVNAALKRLKADTYIISRSGNDNYNNIGRHKDAFAVINTTPVGMYPNNGTAPLSLSSFDKLEVVIDVIYNPARTKLLLEAESLKIPCRNGLDMLVAQAKAADELFFGRSLSDSCIEEIVNKLRYKTENICLIGMPGCGKTTVGREIASLTGKQFVDTDELIAYNTGKQPSELIVEFGTPRFRELEAQAVRQAGMRSGCIIACGGGVVEKAENYQSLHQNGSLIFIERDLTKLSAENRPLSASVGIAALYEQRLPLYKAWSDYTVDGNGKAAQVAKAITDILDKNDRADKLLHDKESS